MKIEQAKIQNVNRDWIDKLSGGFMRPWTELENDTLNHCTHIFEKHYRHICPICGCIGLPTTKDGAKRDQYEHARFHLFSGKGIIRYEDCELICLEFREEFNEEIGVWTSVYEQF